MYCNVYCKILREYVKKVCAGITLRRMRRSLCAVFLACCSCALGERDACDAAETAVTLLRQPIRLDSCTMEFEDESSLLSAACAAGSTHDGTPVCLAMRRGWWEAVRALAPSTSTVGYRRVRQFSEQRRRDAITVMQVLQGDAHTKAAVVVPAVQWAQNGSVVALAVRFSPKKHGPVSVATVEEPRVLLTEKHLSFSAAGQSVNGGKRLRFELELPLAHAIDTDASRWTTERTRITAHLVKAESDVHWSALATPPPQDGSGARRGHISTWFEMQQQLGWSGNPDDDDD